MASPNDTHSGHTPEELKAAMEAFHQRLRDAGLKSTRQRDVIVELFFTLDKHITADELLDEVREIQPRIGYATVYRTLKLLVEQDLALPKDFGDGQTRYDPIFDQDPGHDHIICVNCRKIAEFSDDIINTRIQEIAEEIGFTLRRKKLELYAECHNPECVAAQKDKK
ncbi:Fur family transcriptional regulator [Bradymonas sediminis]|uniref:Transcriptional repressor n=1 Tax=Bradymonas sediminis TaxID=1548548 RepID=A0A2Z4FP36_9DELT|nr:Fur family transcriptional regulator [Bradymonas sediminis]AWV90458.1 transcriptional repressor [Bradymonas sediminis]TDP72156.1 Fur family ferric uptake transcriptional regulator [Bradymonas sediminis]